jgi:hypothetical protein
MAPASWPEHSHCTTGGNAVLKRLLFFAYGVVSYLIFLATFFMKARRLATHFGYSAIGMLILMSTLTAQHHATATDRDRTGDLVRIVRESTERFHDVSVAEAEGYRLMFGCVSGPDSGAMGLHYVNLPLVGDDVLDPTRPEIVIYEPLPNGRLRLIGADFLIFKDVWHTKNPDTTPQLGGQLLHLFESPNRFGLPAFYTLHVWAWKENPTGTFVNWHSKVSCDAFTPQHP